MTLHFSECDVTRLDPSVTLGCRPPLRSAVDQVLLHTYLRRSRQSDPPPWTTRTRPSDDPHVQGPATASRRPPAVALSATPDVHVVRDQQLALPPMAPER